MNSLPVKTGGYATIDDYGMTTPPIALRRRGETCCRHARRPRKTTRCGMPRPACSGTMSELATNQDGGLGGHKLPRDVEHRALHTQLQGWSLTTSKLVGQAAAYNHRMWNTVLSTLRRRGGVFRWPR